MAVLTRVRQWFTRPSVGSLPLYIATMPGSAVVRCSLCRAPLWSTTTNGRRTPLITLNELAYAIHQHWEHCKGWR